MIAQTAAVQSSPIEFELDEFVIEESSGELFYALELMDSSGSRSDLSLDHGSVDGSSPCPSVFQDSWSADDQHDELMQEVADIAREALETPAARQQRLLFEAVQNQKNKHAAQSSTLASFFGFSSSTSKKC